LNNRYQITEKSLIIRLYFCRNRWWHGG